MDDMSILTMFAELQRVLSCLVITSDIYPNQMIRAVCGVDVSYNKNEAFCSVVNMDRNSFDIIETKEFRSVAEFPYISGLFMLREADPILTTLRKLKSSFDLLLVNGHGVLHPRRMGLASLIGLLVDRPTVGIAKRLLCGSETTDNYICIGRDICGKRITSKESDKSLYVSVGHKISLNSSVSFVNELIKEKGKFPEPLRTADLLSKKFRASYIAH
jgi:deoxyribonuclease V